MKSTTVAFVALCIAAAEGFMPSGPGLVARGPGKCPARFDGHVWAEVHRSIHESLRARLSESQPPLQLCAMFSPCGHGACARARESAATFVVALSRLFVRGMSTRDIRKERGNGKQK
jgi:hypothetical protein